MTTFNVALKLAILGTGRKQISICEEVGIGPSRLSRIIHGSTPSADEKRRLARALKTSIRDLFPASDEAVAS